MKRIGLFLMAILLVAFPVFSQTVSIPDTAFLYALIDKGVDTNGDSLISYAEAELVTYLDVMYKGISQMTGIEAFVNLDTLHCGQNSITRLDVSQNTALVVLRLHFNQLSNLDVSNNINLKWLDVSYMNTIHKVCIWDSFYAEGGHVKRESPNVFITTECGANNIFIPDTAFLHALIELYDPFGPGVDLNGDRLISYAEAELVTGIIAPHSGIQKLTGIEAFKNLKSLVLFHNQIDSLDISYNKDLTMLDVNGNNLAHIDVSMLESLTSLICQNNSLSSLDVSYNNELEILECHSNKIETLDLSENRALKFLWCSDMPSLGEVCVWDDFIPMECFPEPFSDNCIYGTDTVYINANSSPNICFETDCNGTCNVTDIINSTSSNLSIYPNPTNSILTIESERPDHYSIDISSLNGQVIFSSKMEGTALQIDLSSFQKGIYFITIWSKEYVNTRKIIKL